MSIQPWTILFSLSIFLGSLIIILLIAPLFNRKYSNGLLAAYVFCHVLFGIHNILLSEGLMAKVPYLFRITKPLTYAVVPLLFLYVRSVAFQKVHLRKWDWLFFLPALFHFIELLPFYLMDIEQKRTLVNNFMSDMNRGLKHNEGILPPYMHPVILGVYNTVLIVSCYRLISMANRSTGKALAQNITQIKWLKFFTTANAVLLVALVLHMLTFAYLSWNVYWITSLEGAMLMIAIGTAIFFYPKILYGFQVKTLGLEAGEKVAEPLMETQPTPSTIPSGRQEDYLARIIHCLQDKQAFLCHGYSIKMLSEETGIPYTHLSMVINQEFAMNFNELVNSYRVDYVKKLMKQPDAGQFTFEALAEKAGFNSRTTFSRAFSQFAGCTPREYARTLQIQKSEP